MKPPFIDWVIIQFVLYKRHFYFYAAASIIRFT